MEQHLSNLNSQPKPEEDSVDILTSSKKEFQ